MPSKIMDTSSEMNVEKIIELILKVNPTLLLAFRNPPEKLSHVMRCQFSMYSA
jgi:hypothetical protein